MRAGIIGIGEVGAALVELYEGQVTTQDVHPELCSGNINDCDVIHVCVPAAAVKSVINKPGKLYIIHSTVSLGACRALSEAGWRVVHAPVRGVHPRLAKSLRTFMMPVGGEEPDASMAVGVLTKIGIKSAVWGAWEITELAKLLCTTRYGIDILFMRHIAELCKQTGVPFEKVYTEWTKDYNDGYLALGDWQFQRPVLRPMPGKMGGHCILPNAELLKSISEWADELVRKGCEEWRL